MKRQNGDNQVAEDAESSSPAPEPFNLFAGVQSDPLDSPSALPVAKSVAPQETNAPRAATVDDPSTGRNPWIYVTIAIVALVIGLILGSQFWN